MPFNAIITELVDRTPGATGAILADWEGEAVVQYGHDDDYELKVLGAHGGILFNLIKDIHGNYAVGEVEDAVIATDCCQVLVGAVGPDYCLVMTIGPGAILGRARYRFRQAQIR
ncbi:MAG TPA: roadblock/LC7 domain-containing protein, partial [Geobacteraceae bacterium]